jgi:hypothetical protein
MRYMGMEGQEEGDFSKESLALIQGKIFTSTCVYGDDPHCAIR